MSAIMSVINPISDFLWQWAPWILIIGGLYFTVRTKGVQFRLVGEAIKVLREKTEGDGVSSFGAFCVSTASRVGTGNVIGVGAAVATGGPGAIFWMWITAILGGASGFIESTLAQIYKKKDPDGGCYGGPAYYIEAALHSKVLAVIFCIALIACYGIGFNGIAANNIITVFNGFQFYDNSKLLFANPQIEGSGIKLATIIIGVVIALAVLYILLGGGKRIVSAMDKMVPVMGIFYILVALVCIFMHIDRIGDAFTKIFNDAFNFKAIAGGFLGSCMMQGFKRGLYSNEAGMGAAPNAAASAAVSHPVKQGLVQMLSVYVDTIIICTATGLMLTLSNVNTVIGINPETGENIYIDGASFAKQAAGQLIGPNVGPLVIIVALLLFGFSTLCGNFYFIENCISYLCGKKPSKTTLNIIRIVGAVIIFIGAMLENTSAWAISDFLQAILLYINIPVCIIIGSVAYKCLDNYIKQKKEGKNPIFRAESIELNTSQLDFWK